MLDTILLKVILMLISIFIILVMKVTCFPSLDINQLLKKSKETATGAGLTILAISLVISNILYLLGVK